MGVGYRPAVTGTRPGAPRHVLAHTSGLDPARLGGIRALLDDAFAGDFDDDDWEHALGGVHALALDGDRVVGHASVVQRRLVAGDRVLRAGYVEGVGVHPARRRQGIASRLMHDLEEVIRRAYDLGALGASDDAARLYAARGWVAWRGPLAALTPAGVVETPDEGGAVYVFPVTPGLDLDARLICDWRDGDVW